MYLTVKELRNALETFRKKLKLTKEQFDDILIMIGDDEELNGIHGAFFVNLEDTNKAKYTWEDFKNGKVDFETYCKQSTAMEIKNMMIK